MMVYDNLDENDINSNTSIEIKVERIQNGENRKFTYKYDIETIKIVKNQLGLIDSIFNFWISNDIEKTYNLFDEEFKALTTPENFTTIFNRASEELGQIKSYELVGFDVVEIDIYGKTQKVIKYNTISHRNKAHKIIFFLETNDNSKVLGINM